MITFLDGKLVSALPTQATVDVNGVGYEVFIPLSSYDKLPAVGQPIYILTHLAVREDAHILYGFMTPPERDLFRLLGVLDLHRRYLCRMRRRMRRLLLDLRVQPRL